MRLDKGKLEAKREAPLFRTSPLPPVQNSEFFLQEQTEGKRREFQLISLNSLANPGSRVLIDEQLGRNLPEYHGLAMIGTLGTLLKANQLKLIPRFLPVVRKLQANGFHDHETLVLRLAAIAEKYES